MYSYSIMRDFKGHEEEICLDIKRQYEDGIADLVLFSMTLTPEGVPPIKKAELLTEQYAIYRNRLEKDGLKLGILAQATIGHGYKLNHPMPFTRLFGPFDEQERNISCPLDEDFRDYIRSSFSALAKARPSVIMVDDDLRLMARPGRGCACKLHMKRLEELLGKALSREELKAHLVGQTEEDLRVKKAYIQTQKEALVGAAKAMREGIDAVDKTIPGMFCACGNTAEFATEIATELAGDGNPIIIRINNGNYTPAGAKGLSKIAERAAVQIAFSRAAGHVDAFLAETDTCPQNRYSTSAHNVHSHFVATILEGAIGAKHWITRLANFEPKSGEAYRKMLAKYSGYYNTLGALMPKLSFVGCRIPLSTTPEYTLDPAKDCNLCACDNAWAHSVFERLGLPIYFSEKDGGIVCLEGERDAAFTDAEIEKMLHGSALVDGIAAERLCARGFEKLLGVKAKKWEGVNVSGDSFPSDDARCNAPIEARELTPLNEKVISDSFAYHLKDGVENIELFPSVTYFDNGNGGVTVYSGKARTPYNFVMAFSTLNAVRKEQFARLFRKTGNLPVYYDGDAEIYMKAARIEGRDNALFTALFNIGLDPLDEITLNCEKMPVSAEYLTPNGEWTKVSFKSEGSVISIDLPLMTLEPQIIILNF